jgi:hypothetical protein
MLAKNSKRNKLILQKLTLNFRKVDDSYNKKQ